MGSEPAEPDATIVDVSDTLPRDDDSGRTLDPGPKRLAARYELIGMLGSGAMGTVYRAFDRELEEIIALKVLKKELASPEVIERFRREVKLARKVTHKNVARTYDIGEDGGDRFLTMEFVDGEMLAACLARRGRLPVAEVIAIARGLCAGLAAAHAVGVVHRDLKPANVVVAREPDGSPRAVITDFGVARAAQHEAASHTVGLVGTPRYMAPEQVEGATDVDARADLYALGTMLYELLTGTHAWIGEGVIAIATARLLRPPPDARAILPNLAPDVAELLLHLMARQREDRPASAQAVLLALDALAPSTTLVNSTANAPNPGGLPGALRPPRPGTRVVAVLPIVNLGTKDDGYLVDGVLEDLVDLLSVVSGLAVRPRGETMSYGEPNRNVREIGRAVGADLVVDGSIRRIGERVRASFRLVAVADGFQLWAHRFDRTPGEVLTIADEAAAAIAEHLTAALDAPNKKEKGITADAEAEELFLRGRHLLRGNWPIYMMEAERLLERAHARVPNDPRISGALALAVARTYGHPPIGVEAAEKARAFAEKTLEIDPRNADARVAIGTIHLQNHEVDSATRLFRQALTSAPNCVDALDWIGRIMGEIGRTEDATLYLRRAIALAPEHLATRYQLARIKAVLGDVEGMLAELGPLPEQPGDVALWFMVQTRSALCRRDAATAEHLLARLAATKDLPESVRTPIEQLLGVAIGTNRLALDRAYLDKALPIDATRTPRRAAFNAQVRAETAGSLGGMDIVLEALRFADGNSFVDFAWLENCPLFDPLRDTVEFKTLRDRVAVRVRRVAEVMDRRSPAAE